MSRNYFKSGEWNVWCMVCNRKIKSGQMLKRWDGLLVCPDDYDNRHPMDFLRARNEKIWVSFTSDTNFDQSTGIQYPIYPICTPAGSSGIAGWLVAGCGRPSLGFPNGLQNTIPETPDEPTAGAIRFMSGAFLLLMTGGEFLTM